MRRVAMRRVAMRRVASRRASRCTSAEAMHASIPTADATRTRRTYALHSSYGAASTTRASTSSLTLTSAAAGLECASLLSLVDPCLRLGLTQTLLTSQPRLTRVCVPSAAACHSPRGASIST